MTIGYRFICASALGLMLLGCIRPSAPPATPAAVAGLVPASSLQPLTLPAIAAGPRLRPPAVQRTVLGNGLVVMVVQTSEPSPLRLSFVDPAAGDDFGNAPPGLALLTALAVRAGTIGKDGAVIRDPELLGEGFGLNSSGAVFQITALASEAEPAFDALARVIQNPALDAQALRHARSEAHELATGEHGGRSAALFRLLAAEIFGEPGPFSRFVLGSKRERAAITGPAVRRFYEERYHPRDSALLVAGPIEPTRAFALAGQRFQAWQPSQEKSFTESAVSVIDPARRTRAVGILAAKTPVEMLIGFPCPRRDSADTVAADLTATLLGRLHDGGVGKQIRSRGGGFVAPRARCVQTRSAGVFAISLELAPAEVDSALEGVEKALQLARAELPNETDLADARLLYLGDLAASLNTTEGSLRVLQDQFLSGLSDDFLDGFERNVEATTAADIRSFALRYLDPANMVVVAKGSHEALDAAFAKLGRARWLTLEESERGD